MRSFLAALLILWILFSVSCIGTREKPNVILIILDTLRADHLGCYGYDTFDTSPTIDSLADAGTLWTNCRAQSPWTLPAITSILSGVTERVHRTTIADGVTFGLDPELPFLPEIMSEAGYSTSGIFNVIFLNSEFGFSRGFDNYLWNPDGNGMAGESVDELLKWLSEDTDSEFFAVLHLFDIHAPYDPPPPFDTLYTPWTFTDTCYTERWVSNGNRPVDPSRRDHIVTHYDAEIQWVDSQLSRLFAELRRSGLAVNTVVIITSDHGEEFLDHAGTGHGYTFYEELIHVPLIIAGPGIEAGVRNTAPVAQIDLVPTVCALAGIEVPEAVEGLDLFGDEITPDRPQPSSGLSHPGSMAEMVPLAAMTTRSNKIVFVESGNSMDAIVFQLIPNPDELVYYPADEASTDLVLEYWSRPSPYSPPVIDMGGIKASLRDLGYI